MPYLALMGAPEWLVIGAVVLLLFGARKLPELARSLGSSVNEFKKGMSTEPKADEHADRVAHTTPGPHAASPSANSKDH